MSFSLWKQLRRRLRRGMRPGGWQLAAWLVPLIGMWLLASPAFAADAAQALEAGAEDADRYEAVRAAGSPVNVTLRRVYLCGEETQQLGRMSAAQAVDLLRRHPEWKALSEGAGVVVMVEHIRDLSPACKESAVFGIDQEGRLSLFDGPPKENRVLRTFYQLDVRYMESSLPKERLDALERGIRVTDLDEYHSVLSSFSDYAAPAGAGMYDPS